MKMRITTAIIAAAAAIASFAGRAEATNLVVNGAFEAGNTGFTSGYTFQSDEFPAGTYYIDNNPAAHNPYWASYAPYSGNEMMIINGADIAGVSVWGESGIAVVPNTDYYFSTWIASNNGTSPAMLDFSINGIQLGKIFTASTTAGQWEEFFATWNSGSATTANVSLVNQNTAYTGNDFALDDISLDTTRPGGTGVGGTPIPEPGSLMLLGGAFVCLAAFGWRLAARSVPSCA